MANLTIVADENIVSVQHYFSHLGKVIGVDGRTMHREQVRDADILLVRSVTPVTRELLEGSRVRFVASATIGVDHIDTQYLDNSAIQWSSAPGCNAQSVVNYVISALCRVDNKLTQLLNGGTVGIIGMGNVGARLYQCLDQLGIHCKGYDPLIETQRFPVLTDLSDVLSCDVVCCHTPLTVSGQYPTLHMLNKERLGQLKKNALLINAGRGGAIDSEALKAVLATRSDLAVVLDVWENEPAIDTELLAQVGYGTAHIAGYSLDGKLTGTAMIYSECCRFLHLAQQAVVIESNDAKTICLPANEALSDGIRTAVLTVYDIAADDKRLRNACAAADKRDQAIAFDQLRKHYPIRREFSHYRIDNTQALDARLLRCLAALNFDVGIA